MRILKCISCYLDLTPNSHNLFTRKCVTARREKRQSVTSCSRPISANPGLSLGYFIPFFKGLFQIISSILFRTSGHQIVGKNILNMPLKLSDLRSDFTLTLGYLNLAINNFAQIFRVQGSTASPKPFDP